MPTFAGIALTPTNYKEIEGEGGSWSCTLVGDANPNSGVSSSLSPAFAMRWLPNHFAAFADGVAPFHPLQRIERPLPLWVLSNVCITGREGGVIFPNGQFVSSTLTFGPVASNFARQGDKYVLKHEPVRTIADPCFLAYRGGYNNYAHWMLEHTAYLYLYTKRFQKDGIKLLLPQELPQYGKDLVALLQIPESQILWLDNEPVAAAYVIGCEPAHPLVQPTVLRESFRAVRDIVPPSAWTDRVLFISRTDAVHRPLLNETELIERLERLGVEIIAPGTHPFKSQAEIFSRVRGVIGEHGAGMANIIFCPAGTKVLELMPEYCVNSAFWSLASTVDLHYGILSGTSLNRDDGHSSEPGARGTNWAAPWVIDVDEVETLVRTTFFSSSASAPFVDPWMA
jgi:Glycosyltransferase 61